MRSNRPARRWFIPGREFRAGTPPPIDFQMHTRWTDGHSSVRAMIEAASAKGLRAIAVTEHFNETSSWYPDFIAEVNAERRRCAGVDVYFGVEIAAADYSGALKGDPSRIDAELVLGVVHRYPKQTAGGFWAFDELTADDAVELELRALQALAANPHIDVLGHPGGTAFKKFGAFPVQWLEPAFLAARDHGIAVEINSKYLWDTDGMLELLRRVNPLVSFGSDAHRAEDVGSNLTFLAEHCARRQLATTP